jgi:hypothetical protein
LKADFSKISCLNNQKKMKKISVITLALAIFSMLIAPSCTGSSSKLDKFWGQWKRIDKPEKENGRIEKENDAIILTLGKDTALAVYDKKQNNLKVYELGHSGVITYNEKTDHLLLNNGKDGEYKRIR